MAITCVKINTLPEFELIAGTKLTLEFECFHEDGEPIDLSSATASWTFSYLGQPDYAIKTIPGEIFDVNKFVIPITNDITEGLSGKFVHQAIITDYAENEYRPAQGIFTIIPKIGQ